MGGFCWVVHMGRELALLEHTPPGISKLRKMHTDPYPVDCSSNRGALDELGGGGGGGGKGGGGIVRRKGHVLRQQNHRKITRDGQVRNTAAYPVDEPFPVFLCATL